MLLLTIRRQASSCQLLRPRCPAATRRRAIVCHTSAALSLRLCTVCLPCPTRRAHTTKNKRHTQNHDPTLIVGMVVVVVVWASTHKMFTVINVHSNRAAGRGRAGGRAGGATCSHRRHANRSLARLVECLAARDWCLCCPYMQGCAGDRRHRGRAEGRGAHARATRHAGDDARHVPEVLSQALEPHGTA